MTPPATPHLNEVLAELVAWLNWWILNPWWHWLLVVVVGPLLIGFFMKVLFIPGHAVFEAMFKEQGKPEARR